MSDYAVASPTADQSVRRHADAESDSLDRRLTLSSLLRPAAPLLLVAIAYNLSAQVGFALQSRSGPQSILWLPNSILLAALLVTRTRRWPAVLLAAFPAHLLVALQTGAPIGPMSLIFVTN